MIKYLVKLAEHLDKKGLYKEADYVDWMIKSASSKFHSLKKSIDVSEFEEELRNICRKGTLPYFNEFNIYPDTVKISFVPRKMMGKIHSFNVYVSYSAKSNADNPHVKKMITKDLYDLNTNESQKISRALNNAGRKLAEEMGASVSESHASSTGVGVYFREPVLDSAE